MSSSLQGIAPGWQILALLVVTIGAPFMLLASTSPLLQAWIAQQPGARDPYRLFVISNFASLAALMAYPWLIEPWLGNTMQATYGQRCTSPTSRWHRLWPSPRRNGRVNVRPP